MTPNSATEQDLPDHHFQHVDPDLAALMGENHIGNLEAGAMRTMDPALSNDFDFFPESVDRFGFGFLINTEAVPGGRASGSLTWAGLYNTYFWIDPESGVYGLLMTQILPFYDRKSVRLFEAFERAIYLEANERSSPQGGGE